MVDWTALTHLKLQVSFAADHKESARLSEASQPCEIQISLAHLVAMEENYFQPTKVARACRRRGFRMAYLSTTYAFDGQTRSCDEIATPSPINVYGRSKLNGEQAVQLESNRTALILRTICVFGVEKWRKILRIRQSSI